MPNMAFLALTTIAFKNITPDARNRGSTTTTGRCHRRSWRRSSGFRRHPPRSCHLPVLNILQKFSQIFRIGNLEIWEGQALFSKKRLRRMGFMVKLNALSGRGKRKQLKINSWFVFKRPKRLFKLIKIALKIKSSCRPRLCFSQHSRTFLFDGGFQLLPLGRFGGSSTTQNVDKTKTGVLIRTRKNLRKLELPTKAVQHLYTHKSIALLSSRIMMINS